MNVNWVQIKPGPQAKNCVKISEFALNGNWLPWDWVQRVWPKMQFLTSSCNPKQWPQAKMAKNPLCPIQYSIGWLKQWRNLFPNYQNFNHTLAGRFETSWIQILKVCNKGNESAENAVSNIIMQPSSDPKLKGQTPSLPDSIFKHHFIKYSK